MAKEARQQGGTGAFRECDLKICELCGWLNLDSNLECFVCGWHGRFEQDPEVLRAAIELAMQHHGQLELQHVTDLRTYREPEPPTIQSRVTEFWDRMVSWIRHEPLK